LSRPWRKLGDDFGRGVVGRQMAERLVLLHKQAEVAAVRRIGVPGKGDRNIAGAGGGEQRHRVVDGVADIAAAEELLIGKAVGEIDDEQRRLRPEAETLSVALPDIDVGVAAPHRVRSQRSTGSGTRRPSRRYSASSALRSGRPCANMLGGIDGRW